MIVFQYKPDVGRWVFISPPGPSQCLHQNTFRQQNLHRQTEFKVYSMTGVGPRNPRRATKESGNKDVWTKALKEKGGKSTDAVQFLKLPKWSVTDDPFEKIGLLTSSAAPEQRSAYHKRNLRFLDSWLGLQRKFTQSRYIGPGTELYPGTYMAPGLWRSIDMQQELLGGPDTSISKLNEEI